MGQFQFDIEIGAPLSRVWHAFETQEDFAIWFNLDPDWVLTVPEFTFKEGGHFRAEFGPKGQDPYVELGHYEELVRFERIKLRSEMVAGTPYLETWVVLSFEDKGDSTLITCEESGIDEEIVEDRRQGWDATLSNLNRYLTDGSGG